MDSRTGSQHTVDRPRRNEWAKPTDTTASFTVTAHSAAAVRTRGSQIDQRNASDPAPDILVRSNVQRDGRRGTSY